MATADEFIERLQAASGKSKDLSADDFIAMLNGKPESQEPGFSTAGGLASQFASGLTYDFDDEIADLAGFDAEVYKKRRENWGKENPVMSTVAKGAGMIGSFLTPVGWLGRGAGMAGTAGRALGRVLPNANAMASIRNAAIPASNVAALTSRFAPNLTRRFYGNNVAQAGVAGMKAGALAQAGRYESEPDKPGDGRDSWDATSDMLAGTAGAYFDPGAAVANYGLGAAGGWAGNKIGDWLGNAWNASRQALDLGRREGSSAGGVMDVSRAIGDDSASLGAIRDTVFPEYGTGRRAMDPATVETIMSRYGQLVEGGADDLAARQAVAAEHAAAGNINPRTAATHVNQIVQRYQQQNAVPAQLNELVALASQGEGANTHELFRAGMNMKQGNAAASNTADFMAARQPQIGGRLSEALERHLGDGDVDRMLREYELSRGASNDLYGPIIEDFNATPGAEGELARALNNARLEMTVGLGNRTDDMALAQQEQMRKFVNPVHDRIENAGGRPQAPAIGPGPGMNVADREGTSYLDAFIHQRRALTDAIESSKGEFGRDTSLTQDLRNLKGVIDRNVRGIADNEDLPENVRGVFQRWGDANDNRANLEGLRRAYMDGSNLNLTASKGNSLVKLERTLTQFNRMGDERGEMFMRGVMAQLKSAIEGKGDFHNVATIFSNRKMRNLMGRFMGEEPAEDFYQLVRRANLSTRSQRADKNSPTGSILAEKERAQVFARLRAVLETMVSPSKAIGAGSDYLEQLFFRQRLQSQMELLGANTDEPHRLLETLRRLEQAQGAPQGGFGVNVPPPTGPFVGIAGGVQAGEEDR